MGQRFFISLIFIFFAVLSFAQIPIKKFYPSIFHLDSLLQKEMTDSGFTMEFNRWVQVADMNNDGKLDFITQPYINNKRKDGLLSIFFNTSKDSIPSFNNKRKYSVYTQGDPSQFSIGDVNEDGKLDILEPTENYHGQDSNKSIYLYPNGGDHTPDKLFLQNDTGFRTITFPDNFNTLDGNLYDLEGNGKPKIIIANYDLPKDIDRNIKVPAVNRDLFPDLNWNDHSQGKNSPYDFNNDGIPDIITYRRLDNLSPLPPILEIKDYSGKTIFTFNIKEKNPNIRDSLNGLLIDFHDLNGDGKLDLVLSYMGEWWHGPNGAPGSFASYFGINTYLLLSKNGNLEYDLIELLNEPTDVRFGVSLFDWDFDGLVDILPGSMQDGVFYKNLGNNKFDKRTLTPLFISEMYNKVDFDHDGILDYVNLWVSQKDEFGNYDKKDSVQRLTIVTSKKAQQYIVVGKKIEKSITMSANVVSSERITMVDGDGDGDLDLIVGGVLVENNNWSYFQDYFENTGSQFEYRENYIEIDKTLIGEFQAWTYDIDHDGDMDLFYPTYSKSKLNTISNEYFWWENTKRGFKIRKSFNLNFMDSSLLYQYDLQNDKLVRNTFFAGPNNTSKYLIKAGQIRSSNKYYNYFPIAINGDKKVDTIRVLAFKKGTNLSILDKCDTIANIPIDYISKNGYKYYYTPVNDWGMFVSDLNKDGKLEVITEEGVNGYTGPYNIDTMPSGSRIQIYDKTGNVSNRFLDSTLQYDPQMISNTDGITLIDINGDGLDDILPFVGWGWLSYQHPETAKIDFERLNKRILLYDGIKFKSFSVDLTNQTTDFINQQIGYAYYYPMNLDTSQEKSILIVKGIKSNSGSSLLDAVPAIKLDFSQFKFPCATNPPKYNLTGKTILCGINDSSLIKIDSVLGYNTQWKINNQVVSSTNQILVKDTAQIKLTIKNSGGCSVEKIFNIVKNVTPASPSIFRDTSSFLVASTNAVTWYKDGTVISDTAQKIKPTSAGSYSAKTTQNGCTSNLSSPYYYLVTDIINLSAGEFIRLAPNPFSNQLNFDFVVKGYQRLNLEVFDISTGTKLASKQNLTPGIPIFLGQLSSGTYLIKVTSADNKISYQFKMVKL